MSEEVWLCHSADFQSASRQDACATCREREVTCTKKCIGFQRESVYLLRAKQKAQRSSYQLKERMPLNLAEITGNASEQLRFFALLNLGMAQSLADGIIGAAEALRLLDNAENCLYVRERFRNKHANAIMSHGVQMPDLFEALPVEESSREFLRELEKICALCTHLLTAKISAKAAKRLTA